ncbi:MAG TPA: pilus assembly protein TadG-related protein [Jatrophihabitantaceae bacterium]
MIERLRDDRGSVIPLILGCWLLVMLIVAGYVAATDAFAKRVDLQDVCDGAAIAAANSVDLAGGRDVGGAQSGGYLQLDDVQTAVDAYIARDEWRGAVRLDASLSADRTQVSLTCTRRSKIAFGWLFGKQRGVVARVNSTARSSVLTPP